MRKEVYACDFCGKSEHEVTELVKGLKNACICNECIQKSVDFLEEVRRKKAGKAAEGGSHE